ncbi:MAG: pseudouridine synthase [Candidatus Caenarcaniphilales bacterium]|nr:pseudouridine synthase [Candidatus Caenarcaniphilales bacterium]
MRFGLVKLAQAVAQLYGISRREATSWIDRGFISVNGRICDQFSLEVDAAYDRIESKNPDLKKVGNLKRFAYLALYKPVGIETTLIKKTNSLYRIIDSIGIPTLKPVGRLDLDSEGLLLLTDDGEFNHQLTHPKSKVPKLYMIEVDSKPDTDQLSLIKKLFRKIHYRAPKGFEIELGEGKYRQIRRLCAEAGLTVRTLKRLKLGSLSLGDLKPGEWRSLTSDEIESLRQISKISLTPP